METTTERVKRSEKLLPQERAEYAQAIAKFDTKIDAAEFFKFSTVTLDAVSLKGSARPETVRNIREKLQWLKENEITDQQATTA